MGRTRRKKRRRRILIKKITVLFLILLMVEVGVVTAKNILKAFALTGADVSPAKENEEVILSEEKLPEEHMIETEGLSQAGIPTGCESVTTVMALRYQGVDITVEEFIDIFLPKENFYKKDGVIYGANPHEAFAGSPYETGSLGCFSEVIEDSLRTMKEWGIEGTENMVIRNITGAGMEELEDYIAKDIPVICWVTIDMKEPSDGMEYRLTTGGSYTWIAGEHCMLLVGYDGNFYYFRDPLSDGMLVSYEKRLVQARYEAMGKEAVVIYNGESF